MRFAFIRPLLVAVALSGSVAACAVANKQETAGQYVDDASISTQVRSQIIADPNVKLSQVDVTTLKGEVQLSGFVQNAAAKARAQQIAAGVGGVKAVRNDIVIRP